jgi:hypothetical protein
MLRHVRLMNSPSSTAAATALPRHTRCMCPPGRLSSRYRARSACITRTSLYDLLGVTSSASTGDIRTAYRRLAARYHPDVNSSLIAHEKFQVCQPQKYLCRWCSKCSHVRSYVPAKFQQMLCPLHYNHQEQQQQQQLSHTTCTASMSPLQSKLTVPSMPCNPLPVCQLRTPHANHPHVHAVIGKPPSRLGWCLIQSAVGA